MPWRGPHSSPGRSRFRFSSDSRVYRRARGRRPVLLIFLSPCRARLVGPHGRQRLRAPSLTSSPGALAPYGAAIMAPSLGATDTERPLQSFRTRCTRNPPTYGSLSASRDISNIFRSFCPSYESLSASWDMPSISRSSCPTYESPAASRHTIRNSRSHDSSRGHRQPHRVSFHIYGTYSRSIRGNQADNVHS